MSEIIESKATTCCFEVSISDEKFLFSFAEENLYVNCLSFSLEQLLLVSIYICTEIGQMRLQ